MWWFLCSFSFRPAFLKVGEQLPIRLLIAEEDSRHLNDVLCMV
jgi:hypothetical protein